MQNTSGCVFPAGGWTHACNIDLNIDLYQFKCAMCSEPPTDLLDLFFSHMLGMSNVQLHPWNTCTKKVVSQLAPDVSWTAYEKDPGFTFRTVIWTRLLIFCRKWVRLFYFKFWCCQEVLKIWLLLQSPKNLGCSAFIHFHGCLHPSVIRPSKSAKIRLWNGWWQLSRSPEFITCYAPV